ncbi:PTS sugar transporter subunit IIC [Lactobacillus crispatus]|uniref:Permease IIC component n=1 Tax=Lactobacillus crispatus TaxID=47770 RepID=A0A5M9Z1D6_9LACO|nr:PTS sugar transporter subunit IIC [Lactobacillus crispatus]KAA8812274.1 PTS sugar transporter subunit IIC [Lactobacillus crispatus]KRK33482.1 PTS system, lactose cellobiose family IIC component [Lactobacillus crispatus DSM 20584 = JCM 1185 = ATCC 33820]MBW9143446.1 PTS sugar transporter subunit IIC [Lactobacillus crispatus]ORE83004.1 PTS cellobiose transporter subunit IIC [Lactobacillus crispatus]QWW29565.1 PTS sugar transporter subunit IIC [Lactobacillus crispatus]
MKGLMDFLQNKLAPVGEKISKQRHLKALREGFMLAMPLVLVGSIFLLLASFPIPAYTTWLTKTGIGPMLTRLANNSFGLIALLTTFGVAYRLAESYKVEGLPAGALAVASMLLVTPPLISKTGATTAQGVPYSALGGQGLFTAIVVGYITAEIYRWFIQKNFVIKMPESVPKVVGQSFMALTPGAVILIFFELINIVLTQVHIVSLNSLLAVVIGLPLGLIADSIGGTFLAIFLNSLFWFCGVNGGQVVNTVMQPIWLQFTDANRVALQHGAAVLPHIITQPFIDLFVYMGGGGATIGLAICLMFFSKSKEYKTLGKVSGIPALFNINTAILFSFPTVLNPIMLIPFIINPMINALVTYLAMLWHWIPYTTGVMLPWTTPPIIGGFLATGGSWSAAVFQLVLVIISVLIYYPFFKAADNAHLKAEQAK